MSHTTPDTEGKGAAALRELLDRVEKATGPDLQLDSDLEIELDRDGFFARLSELAYPYTASLDASLALVERVLPGADWRLQTAPDGREGFWAVVIYMDRRATVAANTPALALLASMLKALLSTQDDANG